MKAMYAGFAAIILIAVAAHFILAEFGISSSDAFSGPAVRIE
jgi:hypothetical protein